MTHTVTLERHSRTGLYRATCLCGWVRYSYDLEKLRIEADAHPTDRWVPVDPAHEPAHEPAR
jgi:hypothetical protein